MKWLGMNASRSIRSPGFTLIELLIVVGIIALLAGIAVPNFLEAQTRAKVSRAMADQRTIATALESYRVDQPDYPLNDGIYNVVPKSLTTPVAYLTTADIIDPFSEKETHPIYGNLARNYTYHKIVDFQEFMQVAQLGYPPPREAVDVPALNEGALKKYGKWKLVSNGPDRTYSNSLIFEAMDPILWGSDIRYDPSNGSVSWGNIIRTQRAEGER
jgi:prepilin-type N-terminal cleavage/methylation domain-containing protein